jgi:hypothetical protein
MTPARLQKSLTDQIVVLCTKGDANKRSTVVRSPFWRLR